MWLFRYDSDGGDGGGYGGGRDGGRGGRGRGEDYDDDRYSKYGGYSTLQTDGPGRLCGAGSMKTGRSMTS